MCGIVLVREPWKGCSVRVARFAGRGGRNQVEVDRDSGAPAGLVSRPALESVWVELGRNPGQGFRWETLRGRNPREQPVAGELTPAGPPGTLERVGAQKPRLVGPARCLGSGNNGGRNGKWVLPPGNVADTFREGKAPKGESHERCRCEKEPARARRE
jgi:hypothetical protein